MSILIPTDKIEKRKRRNGLSPTQRSLACLRENGWEAHIVEKWIPARGQMKFGRRIDAFGFGDILAMRPPMAGDPAGSIALVQCFSTDFAAHKDKILALPAFYTWKKAGGRVFLQGWSKRGPRGAKKTFQLREEEL